MDSLIFDHYDYSMNDFYENNKKNTYYLEESKLITLFCQVYNFLVFMIENNINYEFIWDKTIYISTEGELKMAHPFLFDKFY